MAPHRLLVHFRDRSVRRMSRLLHTLDQDLAPLDAKLLDVELIEQADPRDFMDKFLAFHHELHLERILQIRTRALDRDVRILLPMDANPLWPYSVEIDLAVPSLCTAVYEQGFVRKRWVTAPKNDDLAASLRSLQLPKVQWTGSNLVSKHKLRRAFELIPREGAGATWHVHSYYSRSMLGARRAQAASFLGAVPQVEEVLARYGR